MFVHTSPSTLALQTEVTAKEGSSDLVLYITFVPSSTPFFEGRDVCLLIKTSRGSRSSSWFSRPLWAGVCLMVLTFPGAATMLYNSSRGGGRRGHGMGGGEGGGLKLSKGKVAACAQKLQLVKICPDTQFMTADLSRKNCVLENLARCTTACAYPAGATKDPET